MHARSLVPRPWQAVDCTHQRCHARCVLQLYTGLFKMVCFKILLPMSLVEARRGMEEFACHAILHCSTRFLRPCRSKLECVYYGATEEDIGTYGVRARKLEKGEDVFHGMEMMKPPSDRTGVKFCQMLQDEACAVFAQYSQLPEEHKKWY